MRLEMFYDDVNGNYGAAPLGSCDREFNSFWNGIGIFHDVFEHYFEDKHKYFKGEYAYNVLGEIAAMGHAAYYYLTLGVYNRSMSQYHSFENSIVGTTFYMMQEAVEEGYPVFGHELLSALPYQRGGAWSIEDIISDHLYRVKSLKSPTTEEGKNYRKSITASKIRNAYLWGYRQAEKKIPEDRENELMCIDFIDFWDKFCKQNDAEELYNLGVTGIDVKLTKIKGIVKWRAYIIANGKRYNVKHFYSDDLYYLN